MRALLSLLLAGIVMAGCAPDRSRDMPDMLPGRAESQPTIVSLNPCIDAMLVEIATPEQVLAISHYSHDPGASSMDMAVAWQFPATGGTVEEVLALDPDIVLAGEFLPPATSTALTDLGIRVETFGIASSVADSAAQAKRLGEIIERPEEAEILARRIETSATPVAARNPVETVLWQPGGIVAGEQSLIHDLLQRAGFANHSAARGLEQADYLPLEQVIADPPELLLVGGDTPAQKHPALSHVKDMHTERFDPTLLYCGGPTILRIMDRLQQIRAELR